MALIPGTRLGPYEIVSALGAGGMGEVYKARDTRLQRDVALKVLPEHLADDADRLARFRREAQVLASLNHPNVAAIYGLEEGPGIGALVLELVDGPTLADRLALARVPFDEAMAIARSITDALEAAHQKGVIHRDLKPANIKVRPDGTVKVLDFGLAKAFALEDGEERGSSATMTSPAMTQPGVILGTAPYMSPEQATGKDTDRSSDVWAFGCVLYEMLAGRRAFEGQTVSEVVAEVLKAEPDWTLLPTQTPEGVRRLLRRCLRKNRAQRLRDIADARLEIDDAFAELSTDQRETPSGLPRRERRLWMAALVLIAGAGAIGLWALRLPRQAAETHVEISGPLTRSASIAISPDGQRIVFAGRDRGRQLWLRSLDSPTLQPLAGTESGLGAFWSPDGRSIGFWADTKLKRLDLESGVVQTIAEAIAASPFGGAWNRDDVIIFSPNPGSPLMQVAATGGDLIPITQFAPAHQRHVSPQFLPDQRRFLFFVGGTPEAQGVYVGELGVLEAKRLLPASSPAVFAAPGHLLFVREGKLLAQAFDPEQAALLSDPFLVSGQLSGVTSLTASGHTIAYRTESADTGQRQFVWFDRSGKELERIAYPDTMSQGPALSHDGRRIAVFRSVNGNVDIWTYETTRRTWDRHTFHAGDEIFALWSPDDRRIAFGARRGFMDLYWKELSGPPETEELLFSAANPSFPMDWSRDGRFLLFNSLDTRTGLDIWVLPMEGSRQPSIVLQTQANERLPQFSPDTRWMAYESDKTGRFEVYVRPFPGPGVDLPVSVSGGAQVRWNPNGRELFYIAPDDRLMAVPITKASGGETIELGKPAPLFVTNVGSQAINTNRQQYMVTPDGLSFVMNSVPDQGTSSAIHLILNWQPRR